ncbi:hotdog fold thioesterase [Gynurincola endophyticus]|jgi:1,4-dihydroxy-2-naphthoyl-CoA hydrolase|uniref:hotdog fold thioesterase n=1 Tax=Gynurincola endophyticus TaxID=2479004 RepID=UPI000F8DC5C9|nr:hotdog fold thioesterase [Gynurincola endophyticus]
MVWFRNDLHLDAINALGKNTIGELIGIRFTEIGDDYLKATMPVDHRTKQPYGLLHGGASCVLAETLGSVAAALTVDDKQFKCVGLDINANHLRSATSGYVTGITKPIHIGRTTQVWEIKITDERDKLICISRLTVAVIKA